MSIPKHREESASAPAGPREKATDEMLAQLEHDGWLEGLVESIRANRIEHGLNPDTGLPQL